MKSITGVTHVLPGGAADLVIGGIVRISGVISDGEEYDIRTGKTGTVKFRMLHDLHGTGH